MNFQAIQYQPLESFASLKATHTHFNIFLLKTLWEMGCVAPTHRPVCGFHALRMPVLFAWNQSCKIQPQQKPRLQKLQWLVVWSNDEVHSSGTSEGTYSDRLSLDI